MAPNNVEFNSDELVAPAWLDEKFLAKVLLNCESNNSRDLEVKKFTLSPATAKGDHYASVMFRASIDYRVAGVDKHKSIIIKTMPEVEGHKKDMLANTHIFETEIGMYTEVLPHFEQILRDIGDDTILMAACLYHQLSPRKLIVFEDVVPKGYTVLRGRSVNDEEVKAAYMKLAKWHAISYKINKENPAFFNKYRHSAMTMPNAFDNPLISQGIHNFIEAYKDEPILSKCIPYLEKLKPELLKKVHDSFVEYRESPQANDYYVLCHGDFHFKNMMFKHNANDGKFEDVLLLDFQFCYMGPIVMDLIYSIFMLLDYDIRANFSEYLNFYLTHFRDTLKKIGYKGLLPNISRLREQLMQHKHLDIFLLTTFMPAFDAFKDGSVDPEQMMTSPDYRKSLYKNEKVVKELQRMLLRYEELGYVECH